MAKADRESNLPWSAPGSLGWTVASRHAWRGSVGRAQLDGPLAARWTAIYERHMGFADRMLMRAEPGDGTPGRKWPVVVARRRRRSPFEPQGASAGEFGQDDGPAVVADRQASASEPEFESKSASESEPEISQPTAARPVHPSAPASTPVVGAASGAIRGAEASDQSAREAALLAAPEAGPRGAAAPVSDGVSRAFRSGVAAPAVVDAVPLPMSASAGAPQPDGQALAVRRRIEAAVAGPDVPPASSPADVVRSEALIARSKSDRTGESPDADAGGSDSDFSPPPPPPPGRVLVKTAPDSAGGAASALEEVKRDSSSPPMLTVAAGAAVGSATPIGTPAEAGAGLAQALQQSPMASVSHEPLRADVLPGMHGDGSVSSQPPPEPVSPRLPLPVVVNRAASSRTPTGAVPQMPPADSSPTATKVRSAAAQVPGPSVALADAGLSVEAPGSVPGALRSPEPEAGSAASAGEWRRDDAHASAVAAEVSLSKDEDSPTGPRGVERRGKVADLSHRKDGEPSERAALSSLAVDAGAVASAPASSLTQAALPIARVAASILPLRSDPLNALPAVPRHERRPPRADAAADRASTLAAPLRSQISDASPLVSLPVPAAGTSAVVAPARAAPLAAVPGVDAPRRAEPPTKPQAATGVAPAPAMDDASRANHALVRPEDSAAAVVDAATSLDAAARPTGAVSMPASAAKGLSPLESARLGRTTTQLSRGALPPAPPADALESDRIGRGTQPEMGAAATPAGGALGERSAAAEFVDSQGKPAGPRLGPVGDHKLPTVAPEPSRLTDEGPPLVRVASFAAAREVPTVPHATEAVRVARAVVPATMNAAAPRSTTAAAIRHALRAEVASGVVGGRSADDSEGSPDSRTDDARDHLPVVAATRVIAPAAAEEFPREPTRTDSPRSDLATSPSPAPSVLPHVLARTPRRDSGADLPDATAALQPLPSETVQHGVVPARIGLSDDLLPPVAGAPPNADRTGRGQDIDEVVERALQALMQRLEIERERRGFAKWH